MTVGSACRVRSFLAFSSDFPGSEVHVNTTNGVVKLEGYARNAQQGEAYLKAGS